MNEVLLEGTTSKYDTVAALKAARSNTELRNDEFLEKYGLQPASSSSSKSKDTDQIKEKTKDTKEKNKNDKKRKRERSASHSPPRKSKGGGKSGKGGNVYLTKTPKGQGICFKYNHKRGCERKGCNHAHVCQICLAESHGAPACPNRKGD